MGIFRRSSSALEACCSVARYGDLEYFQGDLLRVIHPLRILLQNVQGVEVYFQTAYIYIIDDPVEIKARYFQSPFTTDFKRATKEAGYNWIERYKLLTLVKDKAEALLTPEEIFSAARWYRDCGWQAVVPASVPLPPEPEVPDNIFYLENFRFKKN